MAAPERDSSGALDGDHRLSAGADEEAAGVLVVDEHVGDREQRGRRAEEEAAVDEREPQPDRRCRQTSSEPPGRRVERGLMG